MVKLINIIQFNFKNEIYKFKNKITNFFFNFKNIL
jgi:hypothetical protein